MNEADPRAKLEPFQALIGERRVEISSGRSKSYIGNAAHTTICYLTPGIGLRFASMQTESDQEKGRKSGGWEIGRVRRDASGPTSEGSEMRLGSP